MWKWITGGVAALALAVLGGMALLSSPTSPDPAPAETDDADPAPAPPSGTRSAPPPPAKTVWDCNDIAITDGTPEGGCAVAARVSGHRRLETTIKALSRIRNQDQMDALNKGLILKARNWITSRYGFRTPRIAVTGGMLNGHNVDAMSAADITAFLSAPATRADAGWEPTDRAMDKRLDALEARPAPVRHLSGSAPGSAPVPCPPPSAPASGTFTVP